MPHEFQDQTFEEYIRQVPEGCDGAVFEKCRAQSVQIGSLSDALEYGRQTLRDLRVTQCTANAMTVGPLILENCHFDRLKTSRHALEFQGTAFKNCTFTGACGRIWIQDASKLAGSFLHRSQKIAEDNASIYRDLVMAIDISDATFTEFDARGMPGEMIKVNNENQFVFDYSAVESILRNPPVEIPQSCLIPLQVWTEITCFNFVMHLSPKTRDKTKLHEFEELIDFAQTNNLLLK